MSESPDRIWVIKEDVSASWPGSFRRFLGSDLNHGENGTEYVRADIAERDRLAAEVTRLKEALERVLNAAGCGVDLYNDEPGREAIRTARAALASVKE